jgi:hypothetical protein
MGNIHQLQPMSIVRPMASNPNTRLITRQNASGNKQGGSEEKGVAEKRACRSALPKRAFAGLPCKLIRPTVSESRRTIGRHEYH